jgi:hypothetical protein
VSISTERATPSVSALPGHAADVAAGFSALVAASCAQAAAGVSAIVVANREIPAICILCSIPCEGLQRKLAVTVSTWLRAT